MQNRRWLCRTSLRPERMMIMLPRPTSLPVPAVVGIAINGAIRLVILGIPPSTSAYCSKGAGCVASSATALARSIGEPPPTATIPSQSCRR